MLYESVISTLLQFLARVVLARYVTTKVLKDLESFVVILSIFHCFLNFYFVRHYLLSVFVTLTYNKILDSLDHTVEEGPLRQRAASLVLMFAKSEVLMQNIGAH